MTERWIQSAIKHPGSLRAYVKAHHPRGFDKRGNIKVKVLRKLAKKRGKVGRKARLALNLRRMH